MVLPADKPSIDLDGRQMVFIVGAPRSGTTWVQRLLACHPTVRTGQESDLFDMFIGPQVRAWRELMQSETSGRPVGLPGYLTEDRFLAALKRYLADLAAPMIDDLPPGHIFVEKTPSHALFLDEIRILLPAAKVIHVLRDARDVTASLMAASRGWGRHWAPKNAAGAARMWVEHVKAVRATQDRFPAGRFLQVRYEELSAAPLPTLTRVRDFLDLEWPDAAMETAISENRIAKARQTGGTAIRIQGELARIHGSTPGEPEGFFRKGVTGGWASELTPSDVRAVLAVAGATMAAVGDDVSGGAPRTDADPAREALQALSGNPSDPARLNALARLAREQGEIAQALEFLRDSLLIDPENADALTLRRQLEPDHP